MHAGFDARTHDEHGLGQPVVGAAAEVFIHAAPEFAERKRKDAVAVALPIEIAVEGCQCLIELAEQLIEPAKLLGMRVVATEHGNALSRIISSRGEAAADKAGDRSEEHTSELQSLRHLVC